jgi:hypothetical protein
MLTTITTTCRLILLLLLPTLTGLALVLPFLLVAQGVPLLPAFR